MVLNLADGKQIEIVFECGNFYSHDEPDLIDSLIQQDRVFKDHKKPVLILEFCPVCAKNHYKFLTEEVSKTHNVHELIINPETYKTIPINEKLEKSIDNVVLDLEIETRERNAQMYIRVQKLNEIISDNELSWNKETKEKLKTLITECKELYEE